MCVCVCVCKCSCVLTDTNFVNYTVTTQQDVTYYKQIICFRSCDASCACLFVCVYIYIYNLFIRDILLCCDSIIYKICVSQNTAIFRQHNL